MANSFFNDSNKAYSENLNDGILVGNAFDWTVDVSLPTDTGGVFPNSSTIVMAKVADVSITPNSNLSIGSTISNSSGSSQVYRLTVYPNFNRFGGFESISLTADSGVTFYIANKGGTSPIASNLDYDDLSNVPELKVLKEYDIVITIPMNKEVTGLEFVFQSSSADVSASLLQSNVTGLSDSLTTLNTQVAGLINANAMIRNYDLNCSDYNPNIDSEVVVTVTVTNQSGNPVSGESVTVNASEGNFTKYNGSTITGASSYTGTTNSSGQFTLTYACSEWGLITFVANNKTAQIKVEGWRTIINDTNLEFKINGTFAEARVHTDGKVSATTDFKTIENWIPSQYAPKMPQYELGDYGGYMLRIDGTTIMYRSLSGSMRINLYATFLYRY